MILLDGQTYSVKNYRIRLFVVNPSAVAGSELRSTARRIQSKSTEFVCPSSTRPLSLARNCARSCLTARRIQSKTKEFVWPSSTCPLSLARNCARSCSTARRIQSKTKEFVWPSSTRPLSLAWNCARRPDRSVEKNENSCGREPTLIIPQWPGYQA
jgi:hypothetical protein